MFDFNLASEEITTSPFTVTSWPKVTFPLLAIVIASVSLVEPIFPESGIIMFPPVVIFPDEESLESSCVWTFDVTPSR